MSTGADAPADPAADPRERYKRPESVLVVVHTHALECLLLKRVEPADFWQSITGALNAGETPIQTAVRELHEETGLGAAGLIDARVAERYPILPAWRHRYAPGTTENLEHWFYLALPGRAEVRIDAAEHDAYAWLSLDAAIGCVASWTNRAALERLRGGLSAS